MVDQKLIAVLRCPIDGDSLTQADEILVNRINDAIARGETRDRHDQRITEPIDGGLVSARAKWLYPIRQSIPALIGDEAIELL